MNHLVCDLSIITYTRITKTQSNIYGLKNKPHVYLLFTTSLIYIFTHVTHVTTYLNIKLRDLIYID